MISIIICSRHPDISRKLKDNVLQSIGVECELVIIDNSKNKYSIFSAYNEGVLTAKYPILCFMHEDILFHTSNWGANLIQHYKDETIGLIGVIGTHFMPNTPTYWNNSPFVTTNHYQHKNGRVEKENFNSLFLDKVIIDAVACDGLWFSVRKSLFEHISFDENLFHGFHFYDMDICMQVLKCNFRVCLCNDIIIEHLSLGSYNKDFYSNRNLFFEKWKLDFPISRGIEMYPDYVIDRVNELHIGKYYYEKELNRTLNSKAYRIGKLILKPFAYFKNIIYRKKI